MKEPMDIEFLNDFDTFARSGKYEDALQEPHFIRRAIKLFDVRERLWKASEKSTAEIENKSEAEAAARAKWPGRIAFGIIGPVCGFGVLGLIGIATLGTVAVAGVAALVGGLSAGWVARSVAQSGPRAAAEKAIADMEEQRKTMHARVESEIETMDSQLVNQTPQVREEFRSAFNHASVKEEARLNRIHRAKVEEEVEEAREAAQTAAAMSSMAAANSAMAAMKR